MNKPLSIIFGLLLLGGGALFLTNSESPEKVNPPLNTKARVDLCPRCPECRESEMKNSLQGLLDRYLSGLKEDKFLSDQKYRELSGKVFLLLLTQFGLRIDPTQEERLSAWAESPPAPTALPTPCPSRNESIEDIKNDKTPKKEGSLEITNIRPFNNPGRLLGGSSRMNSLPKQLKDKGDLFLKTKYNNGSENDRYLVNLREKGNKILCKFHYLKFPKKKARTCTLWVTRNKRDGILLKLGNVLYFQFHLESFHSSDTFPGITYARKNSKEPYSIWGTVEGNWLD